MKDTYASVRLAQKPENAFACHRCGRVILIAEFLEAKKIFNWIVIDVVLKNMLKKLK